MIAFVEGKIRIIRRDSVVVDTGGIGYEVLVCHPEQYETNQDVFFLTWQQFREDNQVLYGFLDEKEYELFSSLISVKGVGCKTALNMLGSMNADDMIRAIANSDAAALKKLPGIGARTASQIVLDLQGVLALPVSESESKKKEIPASQAWQETKAALQSLGYKPADFAALEKEMAGRTDLDASSMLRTCLQALAKRKGV